MGYPSYPDSEPEPITDVDDAYEWRDRALATESDLDALRIDLRDFIAWLESPDRGPVIFRSEVVERLNQILAS
jgi:hypothetical protein